jgi:anti-sigma regulatory factor (Ser/Thr protein kinase)
MTTDTSSGAGFRHAAAFYDGAEGMRDLVAPFIATGLRAGEPVLVAELPQNVATLRAVLGADANRVVFVDMPEVGSNPARIIPVWREFVAAHAGRAVRGVGEPIWAGRRPAELEECHLHEALLNLAFDGAAAFSLLCPYDVGSLPSEVLTRAMHTHPDLGAGARRASYGGHEHAALTFGRPLPEAPSRARRVRFGPADLATVRTLVRSLGQGAGISPALVEDLELAVHELACNSIEHGGGVGTVRGWPEPDSLVIEVSDAGVIEDPLVGREPVLDVSEGGRGIWMANHLCDLVQVRSSTGGTTVRLHTWT